MPEQPAPRERLERIGEIRALMHEWSSERFVGAGHTPAARSLIADAGLELLAEVDRLRVTHAEFARFVQEATEQRERADVAEAEIRRLRAIMLVETDGAKACLTGQPIASNPFPERTEDWHEWDRGYRRIADRERADREEQRGDRLREMYEAVVVRLDAAEAGIARLRAMLERRAISGARQHGYAERSCNLCGATWFGLEAALDEPFPHEPSCLLAPAPDEPAGRGEG